MKDAIKFEEFLKLDLRVGEVLACEEPEWSQKLVKLTVDLGEEIGQRTIFAGVKGLYSREELVGHKGVFVVNLEPKKMGGEESQGMMLFADTSEKPVPVWVLPEVAVGTIVR